MPLIIRQILALLIGLGLLAAIATIGIALALVVLALIAAGWIYCKITGKHPLQHVFFTTYTSTETRNDADQTQVIEAEYRVIEGDEKAGN